MKIKENEVHDFRLKPTRACITAESSNCTKEHTPQKTLSVSIFDQDNE